MFKSKPSCFDGYGVPSEPSSGLPALADLWIRFVVFGASKSVMMACFTVRETRIRIISARKATRLERKDYEENLRQ